MIITIANLRFELRQPCKTRKYYMGEKNCKPCDPCDFLQAHENRNFAAVCKPGHNGVKFRAIWIPTVK